MHPRWIAAFSLAVALASAGAPAGAAEPAASVAVLPFTTADEELLVYARPVADAVVGALRGAADLRAQVAAGGQGAAGVDLVVELRVVRERRKVRLEGVVRDPDVGATGHGVTARSTGLANLDVASAELGKKLVPLLGDEVAARRRRQADERRAADEAKAAVAARIAPSAPVPAPVAAPLPDPRPMVLVYQPVGNVAGGAVPVRGLARAALSQLLDGLGYRAIPSVKEGLVAPEVAAVDARQLGVRATVMLSVERVDFDWQGVLLARGSVRLYVVAPSGATLLDRVIDTDTVVGSRGDRHDALVRFVLRQALDGARRDLAAALRRR